MKKYKEFLKEGLLDKMSPRSEEEIRSVLNNMSIYNIIDKIHHNNLSKDFLPSKEEVLNKLPIKTHLEYIKDGKLPKDYIPTKKEIESSIDYKNMIPLDRYFLIKRYDFLDDSLLPTDDEIDQDIEKTYKDIHGTTIEETKKLVEDLKKLDINAEFSLVRDKILNQDTYHFINKPITIYYYNIQNGNHVILKIVNKKSAEKIVEEIKKYAIDISEINIIDPSGYFDSTKISVKKAIEIKDTLEADK